MPGKLQASETMTSSNKKLSIFLIRYLVNHRQAYLLALG